MTTFPAFRQPTRRFLAVGLLTTMLAGCASMAPRLTTPEAPVPAAWDSAGEVDGQNAATLAWHDYFTDPQLRQLIDTALANNRDLRIAILRTNEARAAFRIQRAEQFPALGLAGQGARARVPGDLNSSGVSAVGAEYRAELGASNWELDLWGRVGSLKESALQQWLATEEGRRATELALIAQVADGYLGLRELDERVALAQRTVETREESFRIFTRRYELGAASRLEQTQVQSLLTQAQALRAQLEQARAAQLHALGLLIGADPGPLPEAAPFDQTTVLAELSPGLPSEVLVLRPDIIAAEHRLRAANAEIGAARAAFFPRIDLTGTFGSASAELDGLFESGSRAWTFVPVLSLPIFSAGRLRANLDLSEVRRDIAVAEYEKSIQTAFREVADALAARRWLREQRELREVAQAVASERARLAKLRYDAGSATYLEVLDAQRELLDAGQQLVQARRQLLSSQVELYLALGGGTALTASPSAP
ncbi:efflux transporter outer membrane subunit [Dokdonella sp.]|uniref:efflux transporter outer membrane subunit n=1 Tax=Dokdonella sp. TaxID=2291710 RepID=UPI0025BF02E5|nr:efflux transporter outer membrane subunit [Dokdonella sp.]MBX3687866.1 efflux transporter outer membrane subunit [Dokdonella sp.]